MAHEFHMQRRVEFAETDMAGILHFANYFRFMEEVEHAFFRSLGLEVHAETDEGFRGWARGHATCSYHRPLLYEDVVDLEIIVREKRNKAIRYEIVFRKQGEIVARGEVTAVCVQKGQDGRMRAVSMPEAVAAAIEAEPRPDTERPR